MNLATATWVTIALLTLGFWAIILAGVFLR
jgi:hypothetical protein